MEIKGGLIHSSTEHVPSVNTALDPGNRAVHDVSVYVLGGGSCPPVYPLQFFRQADENPPSCLPKFRVLSTALFTLLNVFLGLKSVLPRGTGCKGPWEIKRGRIADVHWVPSVGGDSAW